MGVGGEGEEKERGRGRRRGDSVRESGRESVRGRGVASEQRGGGGPETAFAAGELRASGRAVECESTCSWAKFGLILISGLQNPEFRTSIFSKKIQGGV